MSDQKMGRVLRYPVRTVVRALGQVAEGKPYTTASDDVRRLTTRECGTLVSDWVEAFTPDLWSVLGPQQWPAFLVADARTFYVRDWSQRANPRRRAVAQWWPADPVTGEVPPAMNLCLFHAKTRFREHVAPASVKRPYGPKTQKMLDTLWPLWDALAEGPEEWAAFLD